MSNLVADQRRSVELGGDAREGSGVSGLARSTIVRKGKAEWTKKGRILMYILALPAQKVSTLRHNLVRSINTVLQGENWQTFTSSKNSRISGQKTVGTSPQKHQRVLLRVVSKSSICRRRATTSSNDPASGPISVFHPRRGDALRSRRIPAHRASRYPWLRPTTTPSRLQQNLVQCRKRPAG